MSWKIVQEFENKIADFFGSPFAVATDCCTHAIELCLRYIKPKNFITTPTHTYLSVPMTFIKLGYHWKFSNEQWKDFYYIGNTPIIDAATLWKQNSYVKNTFMCLSFQFHKPLNLGRGGMILCDNKIHYKKLKEMSYDGRNITSDIAWSEQNISSLGYHYYMTPETAQQGIYKFEDTKETAKSFSAYPDLTKQRIFKPWTNGVK